MNSLIQSLPTDTNNPSWDAPFDLPGMPQDPGEQTQHGLRRRTNDPTINMISTNNNTANGRSRGTNTSMKKRNSSAGSMNNNGGTTNMKKRTSSSSSMKKVEYSAQKKRRGSGNMVLNVNGVDDGEDGEEFDEGGYAGEQDGGMIGGNPNNKRGGNSDGENDISMGGRGGLRRNGSRFAILDEEVESADFGINNYVLMQYIFLVVCGGSGRHHLSN